MKRIEAVVRPSMVGKVCLSLEREGYPHPTISQIEGEGKKGEVYLLRGKTYNVDLTTKARVEVIAKDGEADRIVGVIHDAAFSDEVEDHKIFVHAMDDALKAKTGNS